MVPFKPKRKPQAIETPCEKGKVTVNKKPNETLDQEILNNIFKQAGWKQL